MSIQTGIEKVIRKRGREVTITRKDQGTYNRATGAVAPSGSPTSTETHGVLSRFKHDQVDGIIIQKSDARLIVPALDVPFVPRPGDQVTIDSEKWMIINSREYQLSTTNVAYDLQIRAT